MTAWEAKNCKILIGSCLDRLPEIEEKSIHCCVTSPPYWGLRDYGTATWDGGEPECDHKGEPLRTKAYINANCGTGNDVKNSSDYQFFKTTCGKCGATRVDSQLGLEPTPELYVEKMVAVFREVRRVLRDDGTLWLNLGDSYANQKGSDTPGVNAQVGSTRAGVQVASKRPPAGLKPKDLVGIPWRVAFALQSDGWYLRQDIIWAKPNPMPESVTDRCTKSHEYIFLLSKSERYWFDNEAIKEPASYAGQRRGGSTNRYEQNNAGMDCKVYDTRNKRSVWTVNPRPYKEAHFATFPPKLIEPCILAGCPENGTVLDPFMGSGTTAEVALKLGRKAIGCELNLDYLEMIRKRVKSANESCPLFAAT